MWRSDVNTAVVDQLALKPGERVVDLGAGMGAATVVAARAGAFVVAVDPTPYMRRILELRRVAQPGRDRISVVEGAAEAIPVESSSVDALWSINAMHHWTDLDRALGELRRVLRPSGRLLLVDEDFDDPAHPEHARFRRRHERHAHHFTVIDPAEIAARLRRLGLASVEGSKDRIAGRPAKIVRGAKG
jgi:ubiquinone/menaquinone biosynthesis C-methylase UbiE